jgi:hypothetical protein
MIKNWETIYTKRAKDIFPDRPQDKIFIKYPIQLQNMLPAPFWFAFHAKRSHLLLPDSTLDAVLLEIVGFTKIAEAPFWLRITVLPSRCEN